VPGNVLARHHIHDRITQHFQQPFTVSNDLRIECRDPAEEMFILSLSNQLQLNVRFEVLSLPGYAEAAPRTAIVSRPLPSVQQDQIVTHQDPESKILDEGLALLVHQVVPLDISEDPIRWNRAGLADCWDPVDQSPNLSSRFAWQHNQGDASFTARGSRHSDLNQPVHGTPSLPSAAYAKSALATPPASRQSQGLRRKVSSALTKLTTRNNRRDLEKVGGTCWPCKVRRKQVRGAVAARQPNRAERPRTLILFSATMGRSANNVRRLGTHMVLSVLEDRCGI